MPRTRQPSPDGDSVPTLREPRFSQSLERGLAILETFGAERPTLGIAEIADELRMSRSTTHRYVTTLVALGYLEQGAGRKYRLALRVADLGLAALAATGLREHAQPLLVELRRRTSYTATVAVLDGEEILCVERARSFRRGQTEIDFGIRPGARSPAYCTAIGKLLLAGLPEPERGARIAQIRLRAVGPNTIVSKKALRDELVSIAAGAPALNDEELGPGIRALAAPVLDASGELVAGVSLAAPAPAISIQELTRALGPHLVATADGISARLGHRREDERR